MSVILTTIDEAIMPKKRDCETPAEVKPEASIALAYLARKMLNSELLVVGGFRSR